MTLEEKLAHLQASSMEEARAEGNAIIDNYRSALEKVLNDHKEEAKLQSQTRIKTETVNAKQQLNQAASKAQLELKRKMSKSQQELKDRLFEEVRALTLDYMQTPAYKEYLVATIRKAISFAPGEEMTIYINASDVDMKETLEQETGAGLTVSTEDFIGGTRAVIRGRNILIDNSFKTQIGNEYDKFVFLGGVGIA